MGGAVVAFTTPPGRRDSTPSPDPSVQHRERPAEHTGPTGWPVATVFRLRWALTLKDPPSPHPSSHCHGCSLCGLPAAIALRLLPWGRASIGGVGAPTGDTPGYVPTVALRVGETLTAFALQL